MAIEALAVAETKSFRGAAESNPTTLSVTIPGIESDGAFDLACPGSGVPKPQPMVVSDSGPTDLRIAVWGTVFSLTNTGSSALEVDTNATLEP
jgi:hypothetical protein